MRPRPGFVGLESHATRGYRDAVSDRATRVAGPPEAAHLLRDPRGGTRSGRRGPSRADGGGGGRGRTGLADDGVPLLPEPRSPCWSPPTAEIEATSLGRRGFSRRPRGTPRGDRPRRPGAGRGHRAPAARMLRSPWSLSQQARAAARPGRAIACSARRWRPLSTPRCRRRTLSRGRGAAGSPVIESLIRSTGVAGMSTDEATEQMVWLRRPISVGRWRPRWLLERVRQRLSRLHCRDELRRVSCVG